MDRFIYKEMLETGPEGMRTVHCVYDNYLNRVRSTLNSKYQCKQLINRIQEEIINEEE